jgi:mannose-6-phosphate isomerase
VKLSPLRCTPILKDKVWGGTALLTRLGKPASPDRLVGESWELSAHGQDISVVAEGPLAGQRLSELIAHDGMAYLGSRIRGDTLPLLYKFIDANDRLSVQVHPTDEQAVANQWDLRGKTECWYIVDAKPGAEIIVGFKPGVLPADIEAAVENNSLERLLNRFAVSPGDVLYIPAGTVHAIMDGTLIYEVQETSDITLRLYDWGRTENGKPRALHVKESLQVLETGYHEQHRIAPLTVDSGAPGVERRLRAVCRYFALEEYAFSRDGRAALPARDSFQVVTVVSGSAVVESPAGRLDAPLGATVFLPSSSAPIKLAAGRGAALLVSWVPDIESDIVSPLRAAGIAERHIAQLGGDRLHNGILRFLSHA